MTWRRGFGPHRDPGNSRQGLGAALFHFIPIPSSINPPLRNVSSMPSTAPLVLLSTHPLHRPPTTSLSTFTDSPLPPGRSLSEQPLAEDEPFTTYHRSGCSATHLPLGFRVLNPITKRSPQLRRACHHCRRGHSLARPAPLAGPASGHDSISSACLMDRPDGSFVRPNPISHLGQTCARSLGIASVVVTTCTTPRPHSLFPALLRLHSPSSWSPFISRWTQDGAALVCFELWTSSLS